MIQAPHIDPIAFSVGPLDVRWYGLMYLVGFILFAVLGRIQRKRPQYQGWRVSQIDDFLFYAIFGIIIGARLGYVLFYKPVFYFNHPLEIIKMWEGGMSFHGGLVGFLLAVFWFSKKTRRTFFQVGDFVAPLVPLGLCAGRIGNFINGELVGRVTSVPWAMNFGQPDSLPRHPSQLYQAALEGVLLFIVLWIYSKKPRPAGAISGLFLAGYGICRFIVEFFRQPDAFMGYLQFGLTAGQWYSVPMVVAGIGLMVWAYCKHSNKSDPVATSSDIAKSES